MMKTDLQALEGLIEKHGIAAVTQALADICHDKADKDGRRRSALWGANGNRLESVKVRDVGKASTPRDRRFSIVGGGQ
jgi:hypothetical protein